MSRDINELEPVTRALCQAFLDKCKEQGHNVILTSTYRSNKEQDELYAQGRTKPGARVTNARGGQSAHNYRVAFDFAPVVDGVIPWNNTRLWSQIGSIGQSVGLEWGGAWTSFKDAPHMQKPGFKIPK